MNKDTMFVLKQELEKVRFLMNRDGIYDICLCDEVDFDFGMRYMIIVDSRYFYINLGSELFPDIDFDKIRYISKRCLVKDNDKYERDSYIDTEVGAYTTEDEIQHDIDMRKKFNVSVFDEIETGCYD